MSSWNVIRHFLAFLFVLALSSGALASAGITYHGRLLKSDGTAVSSPSVQFRIQIRTPGAENCLLYEEQQTKDLSASKGVFALNINDGTATVVNTEPFTLDRAFQNRGSFSFGGGKCTGGSVYNPSPTDGRKLVVEFNDGSFAGWEQIPAQNINYVPMAIESMTVGGYNATNLVRVVDGGGAPTVVSPLTQAQHNALLDLVNGTSTLYRGGAASVPAASVSGNIPGSAAGFTGSLAGDVTGTQSATVVTKIQGRAVDTAAPTNGQALVWSAGNSRWEPGTVSGGGSADWSTLTGKPSTFPSDWSTLANIPASFTPATHTHPVADITSGAGNYFTYRPNNGACAAGEVLKWETAGGGRWICGTDVSATGGTGVASVSATAPLTIDNADPNNPRVEINASVTSVNDSVVQRDGSGAIQSAGANFGSLQVNNGSSTITIGTPAAFTSYVLKLPAGTGSTGQILTSNGTDMVWANTSSITVNNVSGTVAIANGGTGATSASAARANLGLTATGESLATAANAGAARAAISALSETDTRLAPTPAAGNALNYVRVNTGGTAYEARTAANVLADIGAMANVSAAVAGNVLTANGTTWASTALPVATTGVRGLMQVGTGLAVSSGTVSADFGTAVGKVAQGNDSRFPSATCGSGNKMRWDGSAWQCETDASTDVNKVAKTGDTMSGSLTLSAGSLIAPANGLAIGTNQLVASGGSVGIGTATPGNLLHVRKDQNAVTLVELQNANSGASALVAYRLTNDAGSEGSFGQYGTGRTAFGTITGGSTYVYQNASAGLVLMSDHASGNIRFATGGNAEKMRIDSAGNVGIGTATATEKLHVNGTVLASGYLHTSDRRLKTDLRPMAGLNLVRRLQGVRFKWLADGSEDVGFIAQEVEKVAPEMVVTGSNGMKSVKYDVMAAPLVEAVKELDSTCRADRSQLELLKSETAALRARNEALEKRLEALERSISRQPASPTEGR